MEDGGEEDRKVENCGGHNYRYGSPSPWPTGTGQSWSQFKIANWVSAFCMVLVGLSVLQAAKTGLSETDALIEPNTLDYTC